MNHDDFTATDKILTSDLAISLIAPLNLLFKLSASAKPGLSTFSNDVFKDQNENLVFVFQEQQEQRFSV